MTRIVFLMNGFKIKYQKYKQIARENCSFILKPFLCILIFNTSLFSQNQDGLFQKWKLIEFYNIDTTANGHIDSSIFSASQARRSVNLINSVSNIKEEGVEFFADSTFQEYYITKKDKKKNREHGYLKQYTLMSEDKKTNSEIILYRNDILIIYYDKTIWVYIPRSASIAPLALPDNYMIYFFSNWLKTNQQIQSGKR